MTAIELKHQANLQRWAQAIQDCRSSGVPVKAWCETQGITTTTYYRWERAVLSTVEAKQQAPARVSFAELPTPPQMQRSAVLAGDITPATAVAFFATRFDAYSKR